MSDFVHELEQDAERLEERARFWDSSDVIGYQTLAGDELSKEISGSEVASRLRRDAEELRDLARKMKGPAR